MHQVLIQRIFLYLLDWLIEIRFEPVDLQGPLTPYLRLLSSEEDTKTKSYVILIVAINALIRCNCGKKSVWPFLRWLRCKRRPMNYKLTAGLKLKSGYLKKWQKLISLPIDTMHNSAYLDNQRNEKFEEH